MTLIPFSRPYILFRWTLGWIFNAIFYLLLCAINFIYGVKAGGTEFGNVMVAWGAALALTWLVTEPAEIAGLVLLPFIAENRHVACCLENAKYYGFY